MEKILSYWQRKSHPQASLSYVHPEITTVNQAMVDACYRNTFKIITWSNEENMLSNDQKKQRLQLYDNVLSMCYQEKVHVAFITDYMDDMYQHFST